MANQATSLRDRILNMRRKQAQVTVDGMDLVLRQPNQHDFVELDKAIPNADMNDPRYIISLIIIDPETNRPMFDFKSKEDMDALADLGAEFNLALMAEYNKAFKVDVEEMAGNSTGTATE